MKAFKRSLVAARRRRRDGRRRSAGAGLRQRRQDRRAVRHVEPLHRPRRRGLGRSRRGWRSRIPASRSAASRSRSCPPTTRTSPTSARHRAPVVRRRQGRRHRRRAELGRRAGGQPDHADKNKAFLVSGAASSDLTGKACSPNTIHWTYDTWMLANGTGSAIVKTGGDCGSSSPPTTRSAMRSSATPRRSCSRTAARCWARCAIR